MCFLPWVFPAGGRRKQKWSRKNKPPTEKKRTQGGNTHTHIQDRKNTRAEKNQDIYPVWTMGYWEGMKMGKKCSTSIENDDLWRIETREVGDISSKKLNHLKIFLKKPLTSRPTAPTKSSFLMRVFTHYGIIIPFGGFVFFTSRNATVNHIIIYLFQLFLFIVFFTTSVAAVLSQVPRSSLFSQALPPHSPLTELRPQKKRKIIPASSEARCHTNVSTNKKWKNEKVKFGDFFFVCQLEFHFSDLKSRKIQKLILWEGGSVTPPR